MIKIYDFFDYKKYVQAYLESLPRQGYGEYRKISEHLQVSTTLVSQVFRGDKNLSLEMAISLCDYLRLDDDESEYFILMVEFEKSGSHSLKRHFEKQLKARKEKFEKLESRLKKVVEIDEVSKAIFYSSWVYSAIQNLCGIDGKNTVTELANHLALSPIQIQKLVEFLVRNKILSESKGRLTVGTAHTYIGPKHMLTARHHQNWRIHGFQKMLSHEEDHFFYTMPASLSQELADKIRRQLVNFVEQIHKDIGPSPSEVTRCLNIDWFSY